MFSYVLTIIAFVIIFSLLILIHELGHFAMAKRAGIKVEEFGFGLPPRLWGKKKGETIYSINWIPFGGFVRMFGEDANDPKLLRSKRSFVAKSMRARTLVIIAGVVMNFLLAWVLLTIGFLAGMQPLLVPEDVLPQVKEGGIVVETGLNVLEVEDSSLAAVAGFEVGDKLYALDGEELVRFNLDSFQTPEVSTYSVIRDGESLDIGISEDMLVDFEPEVDKFGLEFVDYSLFPRVKVFELDEGTDSYRAGLREGDLVVSVNDEQIFNTEDFEGAIRGANVLDFVIYRDGLEQNIIVDRGEAKRVVVSSVIPGSPAFEAGILGGDVIVSINGKEMSESGEIISFVGENFESGNPGLAYLIERDSERIFYEVQPGEDGRIGVYLSELMSYNDQTGLSLYNSDALTSVLEIKEEQYPLHVAPIKAFSESVRMAKMTAGMFVGFIKGLVSNGEVPDSVAGPVGIAQMTHTFVQEGIVPLMRFTAILSLSLAVINILPFPALDGGRLLFIVVELITGRRVKQRYESMIHGLGYMLILAMILAVTYSDILRLFAG